MTVIVHKYSNSSGLTPDPSEIIPRELAVNTADGKLFTKKDNGTVVQIGDTSGLAPSTPQFVVMSADAALPNDRVLTAGNHITLTDAGAGSSATIEWRPNWRKLSMLYSDMNTAADWTNYSGGTGVSNNFAISGLTDGNRLGVLQSGTGTTTTGYAGIGSATTTEVVFGTRAYRMTAVVQIPTLSTFTETFGVVIGFHDRRAQTMPTDGLFFWYTDTTTGAQWQTASYNFGTTLGNVNTGVTADTAFHTFEIVVNAAGTQALFYIDGTLVRTETTNIPTGTARATGVGVHIIKTNGTTARLLNIDLLALEVDVSR